MDGFETRLLKGVCSALADQIQSAPVPTLYYEDDTQPYPDDGQTIIARGIYPQRAGGSVTVNVYPVDDTPLGDDILGIQIAIWHPDIDSLNDLASWVFDTLHDLWGATLGDVKVVSGSRSSGANLGQDSNGRQGRTENYYLTVLRPSPNQSA